MQTVILTFVILGLSVTGLALGAILRRAPLRGSCGGLACNNACHACPRRKSGGNDR
ncbi:hypothetical protein [uncultured Paracoccus sp.]|uniref:hypothetical protein n=1 Tax=uncultured Paracoccus sp. TaxID=189685 RepID=UPI0025F2DE70|nr:hypothetical protein [uncultured Paracoccus sp.]